MTLISLHLPKTAGTSFRASLKAHFGAGYQDDYDDLPISRPPAERQALAVSESLCIAKEGVGQPECVHGHFLPVKYLPLGAIKPLVFVTWLREPAARLLSHYDYWQESYDATFSAPHHRRVIEEAWSLERFCLSEQFRNIYTQYLLGFSLENFAFVGISEFYQKDLAYFSQRFLGTNLIPTYENATKESSSINKVDDSFLAEVRKFHAMDASLYRQALAWRQARLVSEHAIKASV
jgi:hypothetical protein